MRRWTFPALVALTAALVSRPFRVEVAGTSMRPTLEPGDWLLATRWGRLRHGSVVVVRREGLDLVKRVAAVPGEDVEGYRLQHDEYLVVGDNAEASTDGRSFGPVRMDQIEGVVRFRYWPRPAAIR